MKLDSVVRDFRREIEKLYGERLKAILVYGSCARGEATNDSDIDLAVVLAGPVTPGAEIDTMIDVITDISLKYDTLVSVYPVAEEDFKQLNSPILINIRREGVPA